MHVCEEYNRHIMITYGNFGDFPICIEPVKQKM